MASKSAVHQLKAFNDIEKILEVKIIGIRAEAPGGNMAAKSQNVYYVSAVWKKIVYCNGYDDGGFIARNRILKKNNLIIFGNLLVLSPSNIQKQGLHQRFENPVMK